VEWFKEQTRGFKEETQNNIIDLRSTLIINDIPNSENVIVAEVSPPTGRAFVFPNIHLTSPLFVVFDKIKKL